MELTLENIYKKKIEDFRNKKDKTIEDIFDIAGVNRSNTREENMIFTSFCSISICEFISESDKEDLLTALILYYMFGEGKYIGGD